VKLLYFAWLRAKLGKSSEELTPPAYVRTVGELLDWLETLSPAHKAALADRRAVKVAVNQDYAALDHPVKPGDEIALFPPVTGG
jgi:molybdopterin synthase sulfur carrier subunit